MKNKEITSIFVMNYKAGKKSTTLKLGLSDEELKDFSSTVEDPSERSMIDYFGEECMEEFSTPKKYYINGNNKTQCYQLDIFKKIMSNLNDASELKSIKNIFNDDGELLCNMVAYISKKENGDEELFLYNIGKNNLIKDIGFWLFNFKKGRQKAIGQKVGSTKNNGAYIEQVENGFSLPTNSCIASFYNRKNTSEGNQYKIKIYQAYNFDEAFNVTETQHEYVDRILKKFNKKNDSIKLTKENISVNFINKDYDEIEKVIYKSEGLTKTFVNFHDSQRRIIKKIDLEELKDVIKSLKEYVDKNADAGFVLENIPEINEVNNELEVTKDSIPTFAALLDNKIIERLLNKKIEIPYFKKHK
ncbi:hypothetical protein [Lactobacillus sp. B4007]|uniref:hypothetical protein n=1 Tax=Lactobacillus sp. B4007 TaxID=2818032 RepID=UPI002269C28D|nr:hypothetical protein [Lactobacillus sp. B4007]MCX8725702.1 hypothetical protein [Lactobacillus sp. B4007]